MIGRLSGIVLEKDSPNSALVDVHGVGYVVELSMNSFCQLPAINESVVLHIEHIVREDASLLYGFITKEEREAFRILIKVSGIGPKSAIVILSGLSAFDLYQVIQNEDIPSLVKVPGIGKKTAERLILELRDKIDLLAPSDGESAQLSLDQLNDKADQTEDAVMALVTLGYRKNAAEKMVEKIAKPDMSVDELIRQALQNLMKS